MNFFLGISRAIDWFTTKLGQAMWWTSLVMVLVGAFNVITRYSFPLLSSLFGDQIAGRLSGNAYLSIQTFAYNLIFLVGAAYVFKSDAHVRVDIIFSRLSAKAKTWVDIFGILFFLLPFCWLGIFFSRKYVLSSWSKLELSADPGGIPVYIIKTAIPVAFILLIVQGISELIKHIAFLRNHPDSNSVHSKEPAPIAPTLPAKELL